MIKRNPVIGLIFALIVCLSVSSSGAMPTPAAAPLKIEWTLWQGDYTMLVANQMGFFKTHRVNVQLVRYDSSFQGLPDLAGAKLDGGLFSMNDFLLAANSADIKAIMVSDNGGQYTIVASPDITTLTALRGKRIGLNLHTSSEIFVSDMLKTRFMTLNDVPNVKMPPNRFSKNIPGGIDAGLVWEPYTPQALKQGKVVVYAPKTK